MTIPSNRDTSLQAEIFRNVSCIRNALEKKVAETGRDPESVILMAVTKNQTAEAVTAALESGVGCFGENRVQEAAEKYLSHPAADLLHLIGHLQTNKVRKAVELFNWIDSVDSLRLIRKIEAAAADLNRQVSVLLEYNSSGEAAKSGFSRKEDLLEIIKMACDGAFPNISLRGIMTVGPLTDNRSAVRDAFKRTRLLFQEAADRSPSLSLTVLSMGMSDDWTIAVEEGSTLVRLGTSIFGKRYYEATVQ